MCLFIRRYCVRRYIASLQAELQRNRNLIKQWPAPPRRLDVRLIQVPTLRPPPSGTDSTHKTRSARDIACLVLLMMLGNFQRGH